MLDLGDELADVALPHDGETAVLHLDLERARRERADEHHGLGVLADVDEAAGARQPRTEARHVEIAVPVDLGEAEEGAVEPAAVVEIELIGLVDDRLRVGGGAEVEARGRHAADDAGLGRHGHEVDDALLGRHGGDAFRHADAEVDHRVGLELQRRAPGDDLALVHLQRLERAHRHAHLAGEGGGVGLGKRLHVVLGAARRPPRSRRGCPGSSPAAGSGCRARRCARPAR